MKLSLLFTVVLPSIHCTSIEGHVVVRHVHWWNTAWYLPQNAIQGATLIDRQFPNIQFFAGYNNRPARLQVTVANHLKIFHSREGSAFEPVNGSNVMEPVNESNVMEPINENNVIEPVNESNVIEPASENKVIEVLLGNSLIIMLPPSGKPDAQPEKTLENEIMENGHSIKDLRYLLPQEHGQYERPEWTLLHIKHCTPAEFSAAQKVQYEMPISLPGRKDETKAIYDILVRSLSEEEGRSVSSIVASFSIVFTNPQLQLQVEETASGCFVRNLSDPDYYIFGIEWREPYKYGLKTFSEIPYYKYLTSSRENWVPLGWMECLGEKPNSVGNGMRWFFIVSEGLLNDDSMAYSWNLIEGKSSEAANIVMIIEVILSNL